MKIYRCLVLLTLAAIIWAAGLLLPHQADAGQVCGCKRITNGRVTVLTAVPPGAPPACRPPVLLPVCWNDADETSVTSILAGDGLKATPNPVVSTGTMSVDAPMCTGTDKLTWSGLAFQCATDQTLAALGQSNCYYETGCANPGCNGCTRSCTCSAGYYPAGARMYRDPDGSYGGFDIYCCQP